MPIGSLVSGVFDMLGNAQNAGLGSIASKKQYHYNRSLMREQQAWSEHAAKHAHRWEVSDLRAAGLNPLLSIDTTGAHAQLPSTPSISAPDYGKADYEHTAKWLSGEKKREQLLQELAVENAKKKGKEIDAEIAKKDAETARIMAHVAEGVGTPQQTKNVIYNMIQNGLGNIGATAKEAWKTAKDYGKLGLDPRTFMDVKEKVAFRKRLEAIKRREEQEEEYRRYQQDKRKFEVIER